MRLKHIMLDNETLSTRTSAAILSIGAVRFDLHSGTIDDSGFYSSVSIDSNVESGRHISESTIVWWMDQGEPAKKLFTEPKVPLLQSLLALTEFIGDDDCQIWSCGADFDIPMLAHAYHSFGLEAPWKFYNANCYRTYKKLPGAPKMTTKAVVKHNALHDAHAQAVHVCEIHAALFSRSNMKASIK
jgi:hypothetical protein